MTPPDFALLLIFAGSSRFPFGHFTFEQARLEHVHGGRAVLVLRTFVLTLHHDSGGQVRDTHGGIGGVDVLAASARRLESAGFDGVELMEPGDVDEDWALPFKGESTKQLLFVCRCHGTGEKESDDS